MSRSKDRMILVGLALAFLVFVFVELLLLGSATEQKRPDIVERRQPWFDTQLDLNPEPLFSSMRLGPAPAWRGATDGL